MNKQLTLSHSEWKLMELLWFRPHTLMELVARFSIAIPGAPALLRRRRPHSRRFWDMIPHSWFPATSIANLRLMKYS